MRNGKTSVAQILNRKLRLDANFHLCDGVKAFDKVNSLINKTTIKDVAEKIFIGGRSRRVYVTNKEKGILFISSSEMLQTSFQTAKYISKTYTKDIERLKIKPGWTLISRSGTIGNTAYTRPDMTDICASEHIMRVVPNIKKIKPGYLYAFLSSKYGNSIIKQGTFGAIVDTIETDFVSSIPIPMFSESLMKEVHQLIEESARLRSEANLMICALRDEINLFLKENYPLIKKGPLNTSQVKSSSILKFEKRLDSPFNIGFGRTLFNKIMESPFISLNNVAKVFHPILFGKKQLKGFLPKGNPLYKSSSMLKLNIETDFILSNKHLDKYEKLRVKEGWILVSRTGTIGNIVRISKKLSGIFIDDHMIRIIPQKKYSGIIFLFLSSSIGNELVKFQKYGSVQDVMKDKMIKRIPIPKSLLTNENIEKYDIEIIESFKKLDSASFLEEKAISMVEEELN